VHIALSASTRSSPIQASQPSICSINSEREKKKEDKEKKLTFDHHLSY